MRTYHYTPSVNVYAAVRGDGGDTYYDLSEDVTSCNVTRVTDSYSTFTVTLLNRGLKYNGLFSPFDRVVIVANKGGESYRQMTGYITKTDMFTLYEQNFKIEGKDTLYRLSQFYFDPDLFETNQLLAQSTPMQVDNEGWRRLVTVLVNIAGWPETMIDVQRNIPDSVVEWARRMYVAQKADYEQSEQIMQEMFMAMTSATTGIGGAESQSNSVSGGVGKATNTDVERAVQWALNVANDDSHGYSLTAPFGNPDYCCASLITAAFAACGFGVSPDIASVTYMIPDFLKHGFEFVQDPSLSGIQRGDVIIINNNDHTELYVGGDEAVGAHNDYDGKPGDGGGKEISVMKYNRDGRGYRGYLHYTGGKS